MALAKGHSSKTKSQVSDIRTIGPLVLIFAQNIDCGYAVASVLTSTHNLCFEAKIRNIGIPLHTPVFLYKSGVLMHMFS